MIECVPNISEGRRTDVIDAIVAALEGVDVLHVDSDVDHNRTVITTVGEREAIAAAAFECVHACIRHIDLARHEGVHPRRGACDVVPFVPLAGTRMSECVALARALRARVETELGLVAHLYGEEADPLPVVRRRAEPGSVCIGARGFLIAFNVQLESTDLALARRIAERVRALPAVRALGFPLASRGCVQVSMNLTDFRRTGIVEAYRAVEGAAGVPIRDSEIVGMVPRAAWKAEFEDLIKLRRPAPVLEAATD